MVEWYRLIGGMVEKDEHYDHRGRQKTQYRVKYGTGKYCHHRADGTNGVRLHFHGNDAAVASMFLIKFIDYIENHNLKEHEERVAHDKYLSERSLGIQPAI